jgi:hypothetical protein
MADPLVKITAKTAAEVCAKFALGDEAKALLKEGMTPDQFLGILREKEQFTDALRFLAQALPKREAVFWAYACAKETAGDKPPENIAKALATVHKWIVDPSEENRRAAQPAYEAAELGTPAGCAAVAVFWSGGSMAPKEAPVVPPPDPLTGHGVASALMLAGVQKEAEKFKQKYASFVERGLAVASGKLKWS